jgi:predicted DNA-binding transcriptional regulator YafY
MKRIETKLYRVITSQSTIRLPEEETETLEIPEEVEEDVLGPMPAEEFAEKDLETISPEDVVIEDEQGPTEGDIVEPVFEEIKEPEGYPEFTSTFQALRWAKHNNEVVTIDYVTDGGVQICRTIESHGDFYARTTRNRVLVAFDETVGDIRAFIISNIQDYRFNGDKFNLKFNFSKERKNFMRRLRRNRI